MSKHNPGTSQQRTNLASTGCSQGYPERANGGLKQTPWVFHLSCRFWEEVNAFFRQVIEDEGRKPTGRDLRL
jgi:hypothetical protein